jgi:hypothetical protein
MKTPDLAAIETLFGDTVRRVFDHHLPVGHKIPDKVLTDMCTAVCALISTTYSMGYRDGRTSR